MTGANPLHAAQHVQTMASRSGNDKMAFALNALSITLIALMAAREFRDMTREERKDRHEGRSR